MHLKNSTLHATIAWSVVYLSITILFALNSNDSAFDFAVFHSYRMVFNNLHFPEITGWNAMAHPADATELHPYGTMLGPAYLWCMTIWAHIFGLTVKSLKIASAVLYFPLILFGSLSLAKKFNGNGFLLGGTFLLAPLFILNGIACEWIVMSFGFYLLILSELLENHPSNRKLFIYSFLSCLFQFLNVVHIGLFIIIFLIFKCKENPLNSKSILAIGLGNVVAIALSLALRNLLPSEVMGYHEYFQTRGEQVTGSTGDPSYLFYFLERVWLHASFNIPIAVVFFASIGFIIIKSDFNKKKDLIIITSLITHFIYCLLIPETSGSHYYYTFFYILLTPALISYIFNHQKNNIFCCKRKIIILTCTSLILLGMSSYSLRKIGFWTVQNHEIDKFLQSLDSNDLLLRNNHFNTWPLNPKKPSNTVYLHPDHSIEKSLTRLSENIVEGYELTHNTVYHIRPLFKNWRAYHAKNGGNIYLFTTQYLKNLPLILKEKQASIHAQETLYYIYKLN